MIDRSGLGTAVAPFLLLAAVLAATMPVSAEFDHDPRLPRLLSDTGLYDAQGSIDARNAPFTPQYPLWSDGAAKARWIRLPEGAKIDVRLLDAWQFPVGTRIWKEFAWNGRKVETRMLWLSDQGWLFAAYAWNDEQTEANLASATGVPDAFEFAPGMRHSIPGIADCNACHRSSPATVLGFSALQLSDDRDPLAPHAEEVPHGALTLRSLVETGRLDPPRPELALNPPRIREQSPIARAALGYLSTNCGVCHNGSGPLAHLGLDLLHDVDAAPDAPEPVRITALDAAGRFVVPGVPADESRIVAPGAPERSAILFRMQSRRPSSQMPPLGSRVPDDEAVELLRRWIEELELVAVHVAQGPANGK